MKLDQCLKKLIGQTKHRNFRDSTKIYTISDISSNFTFLRTAPTNSHIISYNKFMQLQKCQNVNKFTFSSMTPYYIIIKSIFLTSTIIVPYRMFIKKKLLTTLLSFFSLVLFQKLVYYN